MINDYVVQWSTANPDNVVAQLMRSEINSFAIQNQASHLLVTLLDVMERARRAPTLLESLEVLFTVHWRALRPLGSSGGKTRPDYSGYQD
jgi:hypothetical protein